MTNPSLESRIAINRIALIVIGVLIAVAFTVGAFALERWAWLVAVPMNGVGIWCIVVGGRTRRQTQGQRGVAVSMLGAVLVVGSIWAAFMLGDALDA
ncbi:hypothetical protein PZ938_00340 [Luteipulveratus sp. YIM 133132]|uniref:DUF4190 domain-containing protein n=1 Tax=Luteipulveratus flavus TaxID=3031728 RepID=A0ABT6C487_9MICO|nr:MULTISPECIES: hypothetical protein [unclassified Luteipulveratus]MDE9364042.1 hypothetical protein [Luteipulveratus sp. YIM 133132]MDF8263545.1 hypothetical protein [Luteipulveratus sp. YIM 133296]